MKWQGIIISNHPGWMEVHWKITSCITVGRIDLFVPLGEERKCVLPKSIT